MKPTSYWIKTWKARVGWWGSWADYGDGDRIPLGPSFPIWRPTRGMAQRAVLRRVGRMKRRKRRAAEATEFEAP